MLSTVDNFLSYGNQNHMENPLMDIKVNNLLKLQNDPRSALKNGKKLVLDRIKFENKNKLVVIPEDDLRLSV